MQVRQQKAKINLKIAIGSVIKTFRLRSAKSISQISAEVMMSKSVWRNIENGKSDVRNSTLWLICEALETTPDVIYIEAKKLLGSEFSLSEI